MKTLIVEDDSTSRLFLNQVLKEFGPTDVTVNGAEAIEAVQMALAASEPYKLICLDIMMPGIDGQAALKQIRALEEARGIWSTNGAKIVMTTALGDMKNAISAFSSLCDAYLVKPLSKVKVLETLRQLQLIK